MSGLKLPSGASFPSTMQKTIYNWGDDGDGQIGVVPTYNINTSGAQSGTTNIDVPHYASNTISFSHGLRQTETATVVATITQVGNGTFTVTAANSANLAAGKAISVGVALDDTAILVAGKARTVLAADADVGAFFDVEGTGAIIILRAKTAAANDVDMNLAMIDGTCIGITTAANSTNTTAGNVTTHCVYDTKSSTNQTGTTTSGNKIISGLTDTSGLLVGMSIGGNGVGAASVIATIDSATQVTGSVNSTVNITFTSILLFTTIKTADTIRVRGSTSNDGIYTVATGNNASVVIVTEAVVDEALGDYITIYKRVSPSNNTVFDNQIGRTWRRYTTSTEKCGDASTGLLNWYDASQCYFLHPADGNLSMNAATKTLKIAGAAATEIDRYHVGDMLQFSGFSIANNNRAGGYPVVSVTANAGDLDIVLNDGLVTTPVILTGTTTINLKTITGLSSTLGLRIGMSITGTGVGVASVIASIDSATQVTGTVNSTASASISVTFTMLATEAVGGTRSIKFVCRSIYGYVSAMNVASLGGHTDWRIPYDLELANLRDMQVPSAVPNATAFPSWPADYVWSGTTYPADTTYLAAFLRG
jgi:hypothetical protein